MNNYNKNKKGFESKVTNAAKVRATFILFPWLMTKYEESYIKKVKFHLVTHDFTNIKVNPEDAQAGYDLKSGSTKVIFYSQEGKRVLEVGCRNGDEYFEETVGEALNRLSNDDRYSIYYIIGLHRGTDEDGWTLHVVHPAAKKKLMQTLNDELQIAIDELRIELSGEPVLAPVEHKSVPRQLD